MKLPTLPRRQVPNSLRKKYPQFLIKIRTFWPAVLVLTFLIVTFYYSNKLLVVRSIDCKANGGSCPEETTAAYQKLLNRPLLSIDQSEVEALDPSVEVEDTTRSVTGMLRITVKIQQPVAQVIIPTSPNQTTTIYLSLDGKVVPGDSLRLPIIYTNLGFVPVMHAQVTDYKLLQAVKLVAKLKDIGASPKLYIDSEYFTLENISSAKILISPLQDPDKTTSTLQAVLTKATMTQKIPKEIDLRFDQPVLSY